ncbi:lysophospholipid acyltransferase family protein [Paracoccus laeviglucosivorans]|uniref:Acyltransferase n=1 Tax=Paracoccus laeviglucosivorans TaxID=1197861 RepID=A0A521BI43_9RHOB|nr:lysophospholipid acyltransferase family protein [Paracoccus laeviglucosivorans]SMO46719.1 Acyltransferase [Paracoccus laeviglucosivorans]
MAAKGTRGILARISGRAITFFARAVTAVRPVWQGIDPDRPRQRVYFANHASHGDFILIWAVLPPRQQLATRPVAGADYWRTGLRRFIGSDVFNALLIERNGGGNPVDLMAEALDGGASLIIFPEGTRNQTEAELLPLKSGIYHLARLRPEIELVPVWIENLNRVLPKGAFIPVPLMCRVIFGAPLHVGTDEAKDDFLTRARDALLTLRPKPEGN